MSKNNDELLYVHNVTFKDGMITNSEFQEVDSDGGYVKETSSGDLYLNDSDPQYNARDLSKYINEPFNVAKEDATSKISEYAQARKDTPVFNGVLKYFPNAIKEVAKASKIGNEQHHPGTPLHWDMSKSTDEYDALVRHLIDHTIDPMDDDGVLHLAKVAWRALAGLERHLTNKL